MERAEEDTAAWLSYLDKVIACAEAIAGTASIKLGEGGEARLLAACLFGRSISTARAVVRLIGLGHVVEARMLVRSIFENEFYLYLLAQDDGTFVRAMQADEAHHGHAFAKEIEALGGAIEAAGGEGWSCVGEIQKSPSAKPLNLKAAISLTDMRSAYVFYKQLSFDAGHPSITALKRHLDESAGLSLKPRIKDGEVKDTAVLASMALLGGCTAANEAFGRTIGGQCLDGLVVEYHEFVRTHPA